MGKSIKRGLGCIARTSTLFIGIFGILTLCGGCHNRISEVGVDQVAPPSSDSVALVVDTVAGVPEIVEVEPEKTDDETVVAPIVVKPEVVQKSINEIYFSQIGVQELTGKNDGKEVERYLRSVGLGKGYAWCAAFVRWCYDSAKIKTSINGAAASCHNKNNLIWYNNKEIKEPKSGDVFTLWYSSLGRIGHTGFFDHKLNKTVYVSVEGNTGEGGAIDVGTREGDGVYKKYRSFHATYSISRWAKDVENK